MLYKYVIILSFALAVIPKYICAQVATAASNNNNDYDYCYSNLNTQMDLGNYDSAQLWLNKVYELIPAKAYDSKNYYLLTRQAEVYYYNNLHQLGLQTSYKCLDIAKVINDSLLLADSYNYLGLFYMSMDSATKSIPFFEQGIKYVKQTGHVAVYTNLSMPHHLHGNLAEAYYKINALEKSIIEANKSLYSATKMNITRGMAVAYASLGDIYIKKNNYDSAQYFFETGVNLAYKGKDYDVALICNSGMAKCFYYTNNNSKANAYLEQGFTLMKANNINSFYTLLYLSTAIDLYQKNNNILALNNALTQKSIIENKYFKSNNQQIQTIINANLTNEKRLLNLELTDAQQKQKLANNRLVMALILFCLFGVAFLVYRYYLQQKLALASFRNKISQDLHDDVGATLSSIQLYSAVASQHVKTNPQKTNDLLQKINTQSTLLMENISDIVWAMKTTKNQIISFDIKVKNYVTDLLAATEMQYSIDIHNEIDVLLKSSTAKRNVLMIVKEAVNNVVKYSKATEVNILVKEMDNTVTLNVTDNGIGFNYDEAKLKGNGLNNIVKRAAEINGIVQIQTTPNNGTNITVVIPIAALSNVGW